MAHAGLDISDDAIRCLEYRLHSHGFRIVKHAVQELPRGLVVGGDVKDDKSFKDILGKFIKENDLSYVKVSLPEEKTYLFQTDATSPKIIEINQNIEFKLEENVPMPPSEAIFNFDFLLPVPAGQTPRLSVSVVPRSYVEQYILLLRNLGAYPISFEVVPKSIIRAIVPPQSTETAMIVHVMNSKLGFYITSRNAVYFTSTTAIGPGDSAGMPANLADLISKEIKRISSYWVSRPDTPAPISKIMLVGRDAVGIEKELSSNNENLPPVEIPEMWHNILDLHRYVPPIPQAESLEYAVAAGLALPI